jgi:hypothetical protein
MLANKRVNEPSQGLVQYLDPVGEDTDNRVYELKDGEDTPMNDSRGEKKPERTYVMNDGDNLIDYLASAPVTDDSDSDAASDSILEESDTQPQPRSDP